MLFSFFVFPLFYRQFHPQHDTCPQQIRPFYHHVTLYPVSYTHLISVASEICRYGEEIQREVYDQHLKEGVQYNLSLIHI